MADPLSVTASVVGIVGPALHGVRLLAEDLEQIKDAPKNIASLKERISLIEGGLVTLKSIGAQEWNALGVAEDTKSTIKKCGEICTGFSADIKRWTRHSQGDSLTFLDRSKIGFWKQQRITSMEKELQYCQASITQVVSIATLVSSLRHTNLTKELREEKGREVALAIQSVDTENADYKDRKQEVRRRAADVEDDEEVVEYDIASSQVNQEKQMFNLSQNLLNALLAKIQEPTISQIATKMQVQQDQSIHVNFGNHNINNGLQMGVNNADLTFNAGRN